MKLTKIKFNYFKGLIDMTVEAPNGCSIDIFGDNGVGKTTVADGITYILFDKDYMGRSPNSFSLKTREDGEVIHNLNHEVEATFIEPKLTLKKIYKEKWTRPRGQATEELSGHTTNYYVDGEKVKKKDYENAISDIVSDEQLKMLTVPSYIAETMHWSDRRRLLSKMAGEVNDDQIIESHPELSDYPSILDGKSSDSRKSILSNRRTELLNQIDDIPNRIDENSRSLEQVDISGVEEKISELQEKKSELTEKLSLARSGGGVSDLQVKIEDIETKRQELVEQHNETLDKAIAGKRQAVRDARAEVDEIEDERRNVQKDVRIATDKKDALEDAIEKIKKNISDEQATEPDPKPTQSEDGECPYCGQSMESDTNDHAEEFEKYEKYLSDWKHDKAEKLKSLNDQVAKYEMHIENVEGTISDLDDAIEEMGERLESALDSAVDARSELNKAMEDIVNPSDTDEYKELQSRKEALNKKVESIRSDKKGTIDEIQEKISSVSEEISSLEENRFKVKQNEQTKKRIKELKDELSTAQSSLEKCEHGLYIIQQFELQKAKIITSRVNDMFDIVSWKMFEPQINGGINDQVCEPVVGGITYSDGLNNAMRVQAGLDIIRTVGKYLGVTAPVIIDNAESVVSLDTYDLQVIALYVVKGQQELRIEEK